MKETTKKDGVVAMLHIGATHTAVAEAHALVLAILATNSGDAVKIAALEVAKAGVTVNHTSINNCTFEGPV